MKSGTTQWNVTIPANATGWVDAELAMKCSLEGAPLTQSKFVKPVTRDERSGFELFSGSYAIDVKTK
jgi:hypothetical protein